MEFIAINSDIDFAGFDCGDIDISNWLKEDALEHRNHRMANTYLFVTNDQVVAYFCISNDSLNDLGEKRGFTNRIWNRFHRKNLIPNPKRIRNYPAIKIAMVTAYDTSSDKTNAISKGADIFIAKPFSREAIYEAVDKLLN